MLPVFTKEGEVIGVAPRLLCHRLGLIHKVVYLFIENSNNELLLQVRGDGRYDVPVGGHVSKDDMSDKDALMRELHEELGIVCSSQDIHYMDTYFREAEVNFKNPSDNNREIRTLYLLTMSEDMIKGLDSEFKNRFEQKAVASIEWVSIKEVLRSCDECLAADGLKSSISHYLAFSDKSNSTSVTSGNDNTGKRWKFRPTL